MQQGQWEKEGREQVGCEAGLSWGPSTLTWPWELIVSRRQPLRGVSIQ